MPALSSSAANSLTASANTTLVMTPAGWDFIICAHSLRKDSMSFGSKRCMSVLTSYVFMDLAPSTKPLYATDQYSPSSNCGIRHAMVSFFLEARREALGLAVYPSLSITSFTLSMVALATPPRLYMTRSTVALATPASRATSYIVGV